LTLREITDKEGKFTEQDLWIISIALGSGLYVDKARELFEIFDPECNQTMSREQLTYLFKEYWITIAIVLSFIGVGDFEEDLLSLEYIKRY